MSREICVVVGVGPGLGLAVAKRFGREGFQLVLVARRAEALAQHESELSAAGIEVSAQAADAADPGALARVFEEVRQTLGSPSVLVYNAAVLKQERPLHIQPAELVESFKVNVVGALVAAQQVAPAMQQRGAGTILLTGGGLSLDPIPQYAALAVGKAGIRNLAFSLAKELERSGIHVATVTIRGIVKPGTRFDPDAIAERYWLLHQQPRASWEREVVI